MGTWPSWAIFWSSCNNILKLPFQQNKMMSLPWGHKPHVLKALFWYKSERYKQTNSCAHDFHMKRYKKLLFWRWAKASNLDLVGLCVLLYEDHIQSTLKAERGRGKGCYSKLLPLPALDFCRIQGWNQLCCLYYKCMSLYIEKFTECSIAGDI
jgi:hypothetical protein